MNRRSQTHVSKSKAPPCLRASVVILGLLITGCEVGPNYRAPRISMPDNFATTYSAGQTTAATRPSNAPSDRPVDLVRWWRSLNDPELDSLVERAVGGNFDLHMAAARLQQARALEYATAGGIVPGIGGTPGINLSAGGGRGSGTNTARGRVDAPLHAGTNTAGLQEITHVAGFDAAWELDLFGRFSRQLEASHADTQAAFEAGNDMLITLVADVVRNYTDLRTLQLRLEIARENADLQRRMTDLVRVRFQRQIGR